MTTEFDLYLSGPMTGLPDYNHPEFARVASALREAGYTVWSPHENGLPPSAEWAQHMRVDIAALMRCANVAMLDGCANSRGAQLEIKIAKELGMRAERYWKFLRSRIRHLPSEDTGGEQRNQV